MQPYKMMSRHETAIITNATIINRLKDNFVSAYHKVLGLICMYVHTYIHTLAVGYYRELVYHIVEQLRT